MVSLRRIVLGLVVAFSPLLVFAGNVNINTADAETLAAAIGGVGMAKASAIIAYRDQNGPFRSVEDLSMVKGIGPRTVEKNRDNLTVGVTSAPSN